MTRKRNHRGSVAMPYVDPVAHLLTLGDPIPESQESIMETPFADYAALGMTAAHGPDLIRMLRDGALRDDRGVAGYAPMHAARALAWLGVVGAIPHLIDFTRHLDRTDADGWLELMPRTLARFGSGAIDLLARVYRDQREPFGARLFLGDALERIAVDDPASRLRVIAVFVDTLAYARYNDPAINADAIGALCELFAIEALPAIRAAYETGRVDEVYCGRLEEIEADIVMTPEERRLKQEADEARWDAEWARDESLEVGDLFDSDDLEEDDAPDGESGPVDEVEMPEVVVRRSAAGVNRAAGTENPVEGG